MRVIWYVDESKPNWWVAKDDQNNYWLVPNRLGTDALEAWDARRPYLGNIRHLEATAGVVDQYCHLLYGTQPPKR